MKQLLTRALVGIGLSVISVHAIPFYTMRSQSVNIAREMVGWEQEINRCSADDQWYSSLSITPEYAQSFNPKSITKCLFAPDLCRDDEGGLLLRIQGSLFPNRMPQAWLADYFGLPEDFNGSIRFNPRISNVMVDINWYLGLDNLLHGLYVRMHAPLVRTSWQLNPCETSDKGVRGYPAGYFTGALASGIDQSNVVPNGNLVSRALDFFNGTAVPVNLVNDTSVVTGNPSLPAEVTFQKLACSRWSTHCDCSATTQTRLSDIETALGWNFVCNDSWLLGASVRFSAPTGGKPCSCYLFEPVIGSGGFWKLGGGLDFHAVLWSSECESKSLGFYLDANIQHLFTTTQQRCFDLCTSSTAASGQNSRYMLAQRLEQVPADNPYPLEPANRSNLQFASEFAPVANITKSIVDVKIAVEADIAAQCVYTNNNVEWDLGYNLYVRSCEKICFKRSCTAQALDGATWALKGDSEVFGFSALVGNPIALAATQSKATIHSGVNNFATNIITRQNTLNIDNPEESTNAFDAVSAILPQRTSNPIIGITCNDLNFAGTRALTHKIFTHLSYTWHDTCDWTPYLGIGCEVEFSGCSSCGATCGKSCSSSGDSCGKSCFCCVPSQWGVWVKGGVSFN